MKADFSRVTIVSLNGVPQRVQGSLNSILLSARHLPGAKCLLISPFLPDDAPSDVEHVPIAQLGYLDYSIFVLYCLRAFVKTEFALIVQDDGWVLNPSAWQDSFFDYDVIGAPVHLARVHAQGETRFVDGFRWLNIPALSKVDLILNGGFSLRSKRVLEMPAALKIDVRIPPVAMLQGPPYRMRFPNEQPLEDVQLCTHMRPILEENGIKFAPLELAREFSIEHLAPGLVSDDDLSHLLGHHSTLRRLSRIDPPTVHYGITETQISSIYGEEKIARLLLRLGYRVTFTA